MHPHCAHPNTHADHFDGVDPLSAAVLSAMRKTMHLNRQILMKIIGIEKGGRPGRAGVVRALSAREGISQKELAEVLHLSAPTVTRMLQGLEHDGLVARWTDEADQRITRIRLTDAGRVQSDKQRGAFEAYIASTVGTLSDDDKRELARLLTIVATNTADALKNLDAPPPGQADTSDPIRRETEDSRS
jgi:DNA-binding MarR family transcriptional regulator